MSRLLTLAAAGTILGMLLAAPGPARAARGVDDDAVQRALEKAKECLINQQQDDGTWMEREEHGAAQPYGRSELAMLTLTHLGMKADEPVMKKGWDALLKRNCDYVYARALRAMALAAVQEQLAGERRTRARKALVSDVNYLIRTQGRHGGWNYRGGGNQARARYDLSNTQLAILGLRDAALAGIEGIPVATWKRTQDLYLRVQLADGSWNYGEHNAGIGNDTPGYGSMTAAGLASIYITADMLMPGGGCPCTKGHSRPVGATVERPMGAALMWLERNFSARSNPRSPRDPDWYHYYWLYGLERVGLASGHMYFGRYNWYREGAKLLVASQGADGSWGSDLSDTCFAALFLHKGRAPILFEKLQFEGRWNSHPRDLANLTRYVSQVKEQPFQWQIVSLYTPMEDLHEAPVLYLTPESVPPFGDEEKATLREFTDTGGTLLVEASCGNRTVREWFEAFAAEVWPEWSLEKLTDDHPVFNVPYKLKTTPEILGISDPLRTFVYYAPDDVSCPWEMKAVATKNYLFQFGVNLFTVATDRSPIRPRLTGLEKPDEGRLGDRVRVARRRNLKLARLKYDGPWDGTSHYKVFERLYGILRENGRMSVIIGEKGLAPSELTDEDVAYLGGVGNVSLADAQREALGAYVENGGFLIAEGVGGSVEFYKAMVLLTGRLGWQMKALENDHPVMTGEIGRSTGFNLTEAIEFRHALKIARADKPRAELIGLYRGDTLIGVYSPFDLLFSLAGYDAFDLRGYRPPDAAAIATNLFIHLTALRVAEDEAERDRAREEAREKRAREREERLRRRKAEREAEREAEEETEKAEKAAEEASSEAEETPEQPDAETPEATEDEVPEVIDDAP